MYTATQLDTLIDLIYDAALDADQWPVFLAQLARTLGGVLPALFMHEPRSGSGSLAVSVDYDAQIVRAYNEHLSERNVWLRGGRHLLQPGIVRTSHMMCARSTLLASEFFADFCRLLGISQGIGATIEKDANVTSNIVVMGDHRRGDYAAEDIAFVSALLPHLQRALRTHSVLAERELHRRELIEALEHLTTTGVVLVTRDARVVFMNGVARRLVSQRNGLLVGRLGISAFDSSETARLRALIAHAGNTALRNGEDAGGAMRVSRTQGRPLEVTVSPISVSSIAQAASCAVAVIYITDPDRVSETVEQAFARRYGLTNVEARAAMAIVRGQGGVRVVAEELGISSNTLKTQLKSVYAKTGARGQADLVRLALSGLEQSARAAMAPRPLRTSQSPTKSDSRT